jgi:predicted nucleic acid-binding Zn finger protein
MVSKYDAGQANGVRRLSDGRWAVDSFRGGEECYVVDLQAETCTCPHYTARLAGSGGKCKHLLAVREQSRFEVRLKLARKLTDSRLEDLLSEARARGDERLAGAICFEQNQRRLAAREDAMLRALFT